MDTHGHTPITAAAGGGKSGCPTLSVALEGYYGTTAWRCCLVAGQPLLLFPSARVWMLNPVSRGSGAPCQTAGAPVFTQRTVQAKTWVPFRKTKNVQWTNIYSTKAAVLLSTGCILPFQSHPPRALNKSESLDCCVYMPLVFTEAQE